MPLLLRNFSQRSENNLLMDIWGYVVSRSMLTGRYLDHSCSHNSVLAARSPCGDSNGLMFNV